MPSEREIGVQVTAIAYCFQHISEQIRLSCNREPEKRFRGTNLIFQLSIVHNLAHRWITLRSNEHEIEI